MNLIPNDPYAQDTHIDAWEKLKQFTDARIAIGRAGCSIPTKAMLEFQLAHAQARDAVYQELDTETLQHKLQSIGLDSLLVQSQAQDKQEYLKRPDFGRLLNEESQQTLHNFNYGKANQYDVCIVIGDGLSALAIEENALAFIHSLKSQIEYEQWSLAPVVIATGSRVALGDEVAERLNTKMLVMLIGERPGLSSPDSMGIYYTWQAKSGCLDSKRNCISNVRPAGLSIPIATQRLMNLMRQSNKLGYSGVNLKDEHEIEQVESSTHLKRLF
ncbi:ethanolamine ammonia-lyase subunit EutC [Acinetobacter lanii]|uniref:Ethanolamine ammonia-lyase small subunit n=1 Tax=Acinetobacter lanii TaxID=2715163 RepID=A0A6G8S3K5_9GAMM|nr:ethanolamine ammonia-lyase subunit EutC [Acinetobacter lanii]QIO08737.1 ethanolamine ammonia-lyase subunit EutC [Acinetobacter lanii]